MQKRDELQIELNKSNLDTGRTKNQLQARLQEAFQAHSPIDVQPTTIASGKYENASFLYYPEQQTKQIHCARLIYTRVTVKGDHLLSVDYPYDMPSVRSISVSENCVAISAAGNRKGVHSYTKEQNDLPAVFSPCCSRCGDWWC